MSLRRLAAASCLAVSSLVSADVAIPDLQARVTDLTSTLSAQQTSALEGKLAAFEQTKGSQIAVLIVPTTEPEAIEQYGIRVAEKWKIGRKGVDDGAILIVAKDDHRLRIEVGYGLEGALNDATSSRIVSETITPAFKKGDFAGGIDAGVDQIIQVIEGEPLPPAVISNLSFDSTASIPRWAVFGIFVVAFFGHLLGSIANRAFGWMLTFGGSAAIALLIGFPLLLALIGALFVTLLFMLPWGSLLASSAGGGYSGGFGSGSSGGSSSGGGFSGGDGSFGGGGASGSW